MLHGPHAGSCCLALRPTTACSPLQSCAESILNSAAQYQLILLVEQHEKKSLRRWASLTQASVYSGSL